MSKPEPRPAGKKHGKGKDWRACPLCDAVGVCTKCTIDGHPSSYSLSALALHMKRRHDGFKPKRGTKWKEWLYEQREVEPPWWSLPGARAAKQEEEHEEEEDVDDAS